MRYGHGLTVLGVLALALSGCAKNRVQQNLVVSSIQRADCTPATHLPVYRFIATTASGTALPPAVTLLSATHLTVGGRQVNPFYVGPFGSESRPRLTLILLDVSGSMEGRSFAVAKSAASRFVEDFNPAVDRVAIAPFGSRDVARQIRGAAFTQSREEAERAIAGIAPPRSDSNTALYSAVSAGLNFLSETAARQNGDPAMLLIVLTDGKNDLNAADRARDNTLLDGPDGLARVADQLRTSRVQTFTIGFGTRTQVNESDLRVLGRGDTRIVQSQSQLEDVFSDARKMATDSALVAFALGAGEQASGRDMAVDVSVDAPGASLRGTGTWKAPQFAPGVAESVCTTDEKKAALDRLGPGSGNDMIRTAIVFAAIAAVLLIAWFIIPRLIWNDSDPGSFEMAAAAGSDFGDGVGRQRGLDDPTQVVPRSERSRYRK